MICGNSATSTIFWAITTTDIHANESIKNQFKYKNDYMHYINVSVKIVIIR